MRMKGAEGVQAKLDEIAKNLREAASLRVGFLENASYPNGTSVALVAAVQNFGAPLRGIPPRPFFSNMIKEHQNEWPDQAAQLLRKTKYDVKTTLKQMGEVIAGELRQSIIDTNEPPLAPATIARKGFDKPLIDTSHMINSISYEVSDIG